MSTIHDFNRLTSVFLVGHTGAPETFRPSDDWFAEFHGIHANVRVLFSKEAATSVKDVEVLIGPGTAGGGFGALGQHTAQDFIDRKDAALARLYREVGLL